VAKIRFINMSVVNARIKLAFDEYEREAYNIFKYYAIEAMIYFNSVQTSAGAEQKGAFWTNHTFKAATGFFAKAFQVPGNMGLTFANSTSYAVDLEEGYEGRFASFPTLLARFEPLIMADLRTLYEGR